MADKPQRRLFFIPILALMAVLLGCAQLTASPDSTSAPISPQPPSPVITTPAATRPAPATTAPPTATPTIPPTTTATVPSAATTTTPSQAGAVPCVIVVRTPAANAPTASSQGTALPRQVDPHVEVCASATAAKVGQTITVVGQAVDIGLAYYQVSLHDQGAATAALLAEITYANELKNQADSSQVLELVTIEAHNDRLVVTLRARSAGQTQLTVGARGSSLWLSWSSHLGRRLFGASDLHRGGALSS